METYEECVYRAKLSEKAERFKQMVECMKTAVKQASSIGKSIGIEERNMLSVAYKNQVGVRRTSWRILTKSLQECKLAEQNSSGAVNEKHIQIIMDYIKTVESELNGICDDLLSLLDSYLIQETAKDSQVFFLKMKGDYLRYKAEIANNEYLAEVSQQAHDAYQKAMEIANANLPPTNPTRLGLYLNYSVFCFEILNERTRAIEMGKKAFDEAISELDSLTEESYKDSTLIMQLLRDNLSLWTTEYAEEVAY
ncbi:14-3-3 protein epsilon [Nematocida sp. AWRm78]|nr:14-3-3 protein epsilon [Nematocida sp. AWRm79]KAI5168667.1 14-3-3 protein epsilon [Nematocida sp. AWRm79]KAI5187118.1 14-3-3 protein epsilon [Nematocida sp. AWRm78]KAI5187813.1 14-3-3 protein epsilon [Nematocida sp. AWRm78]